MEWLFDIIGAILKYIGAFTLLLLFVYLANPGYFEKIILHILRIVSYVSKRLDKIYLERDLNHTIRDSVKSLEKFLPVSSPELKVIWTESETLEGYLERGFVVVRMKYHKNRARNIARALTIYIPEILPFEARAVMDPDLALAMSSVIATNIAERDPLVVQQIYEAVDVRFQDSSKGKDLLGNLQEIDEQSLFSRILAPQIIRGCLKAYPRRPQELQDEIQKLIEILSTLIRGELLPRPILNGKYINLAIVRVASPEKIILDPELESHLKFAKHCRTKTLYVLAAGTKAKLASKLTQRISKEMNCKIDFEDVYKGTYKGKLTDIYCSKLSGSI